MDKKKKKHVYQSTIIVLCLFPLFFYIAFVSFMMPFLLLIVHLVSGSAAFALFLFRCFQWEQPKQRWFWGLMAFSSPGLVIFFFLGRCIQGLEFLMLPCLLIQFFFPTIHLILETRGKKHFFMNLLLCIYIFSLVLGCTILFLEKESHFEFFPIAALSGILLEIFALREKHKEANALP